MLNPILIAAIILHPTSPQHGNPKTGLWSLRMPIKSLQHRVEFKILTPGKPYKLTDAELTWVPKRRDQSPPARQVVLLRYTLSNHTQIDLIEAKHIPGTDKAANMDSIISDGEFEFLLRLKIAAETRMSWFSRSGTDLCVIANTGVFEKIVREMNLTR